MLLSRHIVISKVCFSFLPATSNSKERLVIVVMTTEEPQSIRSWILSLMLTTLAWCDEDKIATPLLSVL